MSDIKINNQIYSGVDTIVVQTSSGATTKFTEGERPKGTLNITENKIYDVTNYALANVNVGASIDISAQNIDTYKYQDLTRALMTGTEMATDEEYIRAEEYLQSKYALIIGG